MPELPEVEVTRRSFVDRIRGARIESLRLGKPLRWPLGVAAHTLVGREVQDVGRRGKYLLLHLDEGVLLLHLGMSGSLAFHEVSPPVPGAHHHADLVTSQGVLRLHDPRRFGAVVWSAGLEDEPARKLLGRLGVEPLGPDFSPDSFGAGLARRQSAIKQVLLAGDVVVGVGNIYACEALFRAGIRPTALASSLSKTRVQRLHAAIRSVLSEALERGGSSLRDFSDADGRTGYFQLDAAVYGRAGEPCVRCSRPVRLLRQGQRSTYYCSTCQR